MKNNLFKSGEFFVGVNYWASNAGIQMWNRWDEDCIKRDFDLLVEANIKVIRMFPLWSDFQPIENFRNGNGKIRIISNDGVKAIDSPEARAGMNTEMVAKLDRFLEICEEKGIKVILGLVTGWMSGRVYAPHALDGLNLYTHPTALRWELRYVKYLVNRYKDSPAIVAWDLGNECNCFDHCPDADSAYTWASLISDAIRSIDSTKLVISGMHSLKPEAVWNPMDQGETTDILCTHPYPAFTPLCDTDPVNRMKSANHAVAESVFYRGCGGKPCFAEEINVLGPMFANEEVTCANTDMQLFGLWAHNCLGFMWWCACNQSKLKDIPYDWTGLERELGLINADGTHVPMLDRMTAFTKFTESFGKLPERIVDATCILLLTELRADAGGGLITHYDTWAQSYGTFLLAKQAGLDIEFMWHENELPDSGAYLVPGLQMYIEPTKRLWDDLMEKVENGATLYISMDGGMMSEFRDITGFEVVHKSRTTREHITELDGVKIGINSQYDMKLAVKTAKVLATNENGVPVFGVNEYGKGKVYFVSFIPENYAVSVPGFMDGDNVRDYYRIYKAMNLRNPAKVASQDNPTIGMTEHIIDDASRYLLLINYEPEPQEAVVSISEYTATEIRSVDGNVELGASQKGEFKVMLPANTGAVVKITK